MLTNPVRTLRLCAVAVLAMVCHLTATAQEITVSAAASLTTAFQNIGAAFEKAHPGAKVAFNFAASGALLAQIQQGAPVDVFASADQTTLDRAAAAKLLTPGSRADFAANTLVVIVPGGSSATPQTLRDLTAPAYRRIATGTPASVPAGRYTEAAVQQAGLTAQFQPKWIFGESVRQVLNYVVRGEVDAGFVYRTDALLERDRVTVALTVPMASRVTYPVAAVASGKQPALAHAFIAFVRSEAGQAILEKHGFSKP